MGGRRRRYRRFQDVRVAILDAIHLGADGAPLARAHVGFSHQLEEPWQRQSPRLRLSLPSRGSEDQIELITEARCSSDQNIVLKLNNAFGATSKATGWVLEVGVPFLVPLTRKEVAHHQAADSRRWPPSNGSRAKWSRSQWSPAVTSKPDRNRWPASVVSS